MKFLHTLLIFLLSTNYLHAETFKVESIPFKEKISNVDLVDDINIPFISASHPKIAQKINDYLHIEILQALAPAKASNGIKRFVNKDDDSMVGITSMEYKVLLNNGRVLTLQTSSEFCGAYCEGSETSYSFDAATGRHIVLEDIFTMQGIKTIVEKIYQARVNTLKKTIKVLQQTSLSNRKKHKKPAGESEDPETKLLMYQTCLTEQVDFHKEFGYYDELGEFTIDAKGITFVHGRCSNHAMQGLDDIGDFQNTYEIKTLAPYLTPYAKALLSNEKVKFTAQADALGQVMYGTVGSNRITIKFDAPRDEHLKAVYFYQKTRKPIALSGSDTPDGIYWDEEQSKTKQAPQISTKAQGDSLVGEWRGNGKVLPFKVTPLP